MKRERPAAVSLRRLTVADWAKVQPLVRAFYAHFGYRFSDRVQGRVFRRLLADPSLGWGWFIESGGAVVGYAALTLGWSIEYGGRVAVLDEIFVVAEHRGRGVGRAALRQLLTAARRLGVRRLFLEVESYNARAKRLYKTLGLQDTRRTLMTAPLR